MGWSTVVVFRRGVIDCALCVFAPLRETKFFRLVRSLRLKYFRRTHRQSSYSGVLFMRKRMRRRLGKVRGALLGLFIVGFVAFVVFAVASERRREAAVASIVVPPEVTFHRQLVEALEAPDVTPSPELQPSMDSIRRWRSLFQRKAAEVDGEEWDAVLDVWYAADHWVDLTAADIERIGAFLDAHRAFIVALLEVAAAGGPVEAIHPHAREVDFEHLKSIRDCARLLHIEASFQARRGNNESAVDTCVAGLQLAEALASEPFWMAYSTKNPCINITLQAICESFPPGTLPSDGSARMINQAQSMTGRDSLVLSLQDSQRGRQQSLEELLNDGWAGRTTRIWNISRILDDGILTGAMAVGYASPLGRPWLNRDVAQTLELYDRALEVALLPYYEAVERLDFEIEGFSPNARLADSLPISNMLSQATMEVQLQLLQIGLTVEQYRVFQGVFPDSLEALSAELPDSVFVDPFTGEPLRYRVEGDSFTLYSAGWNQEDDGGRHDFPSGDIVWRGEN